MTHLYHKDVFIPAWVWDKIPQGNVNPRYSLHAQNNAMNDLYEVIVMPTTVSLSSDYVIEVETDDNQNIIKVVYRLPYSEEFDLGFAYMPQICTCKTLWLNEVNDLHTTLRRERYESCIV